jgi:protein-L-isoaspartate(D-aspartate) O-methyltransferase
VDARDRLVEKLCESRELSASTVAAMRAVPRHQFVPEPHRDAAYQDRPLPIGREQTISAPHIVAVMTDLLGLSPGDEVFEVGTGRGYHAAVTAEVVGAGNVYSAEYCDSLAQQAHDCLVATGYAGVSVRTGDGREGWPEHAPYDRAYLTCAAPMFPPAVVEQVRPGGQLLAPIGNGTQVLVHATKRADGSLRRTRKGRVRFVRLR